MDATTENVQKKPGNSKLRRQKSRLRMQAPSAIQVGRAEPATVAEWRVAIPLLSPLDVSTTEVPRTDGTAAADEVLSPTPGQVKKAVDGDSWPTTAWRHPAAPFYYETVAGSAPAFVFSRCA